MKEEPPQATAHRQARHLVERLQDARGMLRHTENAKENGDQNAGIIIVAVVVVLVMEVGIMMPMFVVIIVMVVVVAAVIVLVVEVAAVMVGVDGVIKVQECRAGLACVRKGHRLKRAPQ